MSGMVSARVPSRSKSTTGWRGVWSDAGAFTRTVCPPPGAGTDTVRQRSQVSCHPTGIMRVLPRPSANRLADRREGRVEHGAQRLDGEVLEPAGGVGPAQLGTHVVAEATQQGVGLGEANVRGRTGVTHRAGARWRGGPRLLRGGG